MCSIFDRDGEAVRPEDGLHLVGEGRDVLAGDEEGGRVEEVDEHLVTAYLNNYLFLWLIG